ncbi:MAG: GNAT family N-acetyltransferase [Balneolaceae bacterium]|nr:GNAT family N-acetyltransferase [Balneolaceae bacterium]
MEIQHRSGETKGSFFVEEEGSKLAEMTYSKLGSRSIIIDHTEVSDDLRGKNVGKQLVHRGIEFARENALTVIPLCPFAKSVIERDPSLQDVLKK